MRARAAAVRCGASDHAERPSRRRYRRGRQWRRPAMVQGAASRAAARLSVGRPRYYTRNEAYRLKGAPQLAMLLLAPLLVAATVVLFGSGVAMGVLHGRSLHIARQLHGPSSVIWMLLVGVHVLVYLGRALVSAKEEVASASRASVGVAR